MVRRSQEQEAYERGVGMALNALSGLIEEGKRARLPKGPEHCGARMSR